MIEDKHRVGVMDEKGGNFETYEELPEVLQQRDLLVQLLRVVVHAEAADVVGLGARALVRRALPTGSGKHKRVESTGRVKAMLCIA
jgi:hypothetical protein